jgi:hypothetical protein
LRFLAGALPLAPFPSLPAAKVTPLPRFLPLLLLPLLLLPLLLLLLLLLLLPPPPYWLSSISEPSLASS